MARFDVAVRQWEGDWLGSWYATVEDTKTEQGVDGPRMLFKWMAQLTVPFLIVKLLRR